MEKNEKSITARKGKVLFYKTAPENSIVLYTEVTPLLEWKRAIYRNFPCTCREWEAISNWELVMAKTANGLRRRLKSKPNTHQEL